MATAITKTTLTTTLAQVLAANVNRLSSTLFSQTSNGSDTTNTLFATDVNTIPQFCLAGSDAKLYTPGSDYTGAIYAKGTAGNIVYAIEET